MDGNKLSRFSLALSLILLVVSVVSAIPPLPAEFYGSVYMNGNPAPAGTIISALINEEIRGTFTLSEAGIYGGPDLFDDRLLVSPIEDDVSDGIPDITFRIGDKEAEQTVRLSSGLSQELDLSVGGMPTITQAPTAAPTGIPTQIVTQPPVTRTPVITEAPTQAPTEVATQVPVVTEVPTETPTQAAIPAPTQAPRQNPDLTAAFTADMRAGANPSSITFTDQSAGNPSSWLWEFGDGTVSEEANPVHIYEKAGVFDVTLTVSNAEGENQKREAKYITVTGAIPPPAAMFEARPISGSVPLTVQFTDISIGPPTAWFWEFGDGSTSTERSPRHTYTTEGVYSVRLWIENQGGSNSVIRENYIAVSAQGSTVTVDFTGAPTTGLNPLTVRFRDLSSGSPTMWNWDFGDGQTATIANPEHTYTMPGMYTVTLTASNQLGGTDTRQKVAYITVSNQIVGLLASFNAHPTGGTAPLNVEFRDASIGNPTMWYWEFGDGQTATIANPKHIYNAPGRYTVRLTVSNEVATDTTTVENAVIVIGEGSGDQADFVASPTSGTLPLTVQFTDVSNCNPVSWFWDFGDGTISTEQHPQNVYINAGAYTVQLRVTDISGRTHEVRKEGFIHVQPAHPGAHGRIEINFAPDRASVILNGVKVGEPEFLKTFTIPSVPPGTHQLRIVKEGFEDFNREVVVLPGATLRVQGRMMQMSSPGGTVSVSTSPEGANVFLNGLTLGTAPVWRTGISPGTHTLTVTAGNYYDWSRDFYISSGETSFINAVLFPQWWSQETGVLMVSSMPGDGTVFVDGVSLGQSPMTIPGLEAGTHTIRVEVAGFEPWEDTVTVHKGRTSYAVASLDNVATLTT